VTTWKPRLTTTNGAVWPHGQRSASFFCPSPHNSAGDQGSTVIRRRAGPLCASLSPKVYLASLYAFIHGEIDAKAHISAQGSPSPEASWLPQPHGHPRWPRCTPVQTLQGTIPTHSRTVPENRLGVQRSHRILSAADFHRARQVGKAYRDPRLVMLVRPNGLETTRFGFVTSRKLGKAVVRNRVRRLMREAARQTCDQMRGGFDVVLIATGPAVGSTLQEISDAVSSLASKAGLLGDEG